MGLADEFRHERALRKLVDQLPGGSERIWLSRDIGPKVIDLYDRRQAVATQLEGAEVKLISQAVKAHHKLQQRFEKAKTKRPSTSLAILMEELGLPDVSQETPQQSLDRLVPASDRPNHTINKKTMLPFTGQKVDTIEWCKQELVSLSQQLEEERQGLNKKPVHNAAFVLFKKQMAAHMFAQTTSHNQPLLMTDRFVEVHPENVIWNNLHADPLQAKIRYALSWAGSLGLIISWAFPVAFVGSISNIQKLCAAASWMQWLCDLPTPIVSRFTKL